MKKLMLKFYFRTKTNKITAKLSMLKNEQIKNPFASYTYKHVN